MWFGLGLLCGALLGLGYWRLRTFTPAYTSDEDMCVGEAARRCPRCGSYSWVYKGDRQVCADCGHE